LPPQLTHTFAAQTLNGTVHPTSAPQQACPMAPQVPHEPSAAQVPSEVPPVPVQALAAATLVPRTQHPPVHVSPSQHGSPAAPHAAQRRETSSQTTPLAVQNSWPPMPPPPLTQHVSPVPPHPMTPAPHPPAVHVPSVPPHVVPALTQTPATQQAPVPVQSCSGQHGAPEPPQAVVPFPLSQMVPVPVDSPEATQVFVTQQPPPMQAVPVVQQASPAEPQVVTAHCGVPVSPVPHVPPLEQVAPDATQVFAPGSQQSPLVEQVAPAQQFCPVPPQSTQRPAALHPSPLPVQVSPAQHGWPFMAPHVSPAQQATPEVPQAAHCPATQTAPDAVHVPLQHGSPTAPQAPASVVHAPAVQVPPPALTGHVAPEAVQVEVPPAVPLGTQHPPAAHESPAQHTWLVPPHGLHVPGAAPVQTSVESQARPGQQFSPDPPHPWQTPPTHARLLALQAMPVVQHTCPLAPHAADVSEPASPPEELELSDASPPELDPSGWASEPPLLLSPPLPDPDSVVPSVPASPGPTLVELLPPQEADPTATPSGIAAHRNQTLQRLRMTSLPLALSHAQQPARHRHESPKPLQYCKFLLRRDYALSCEPDLRQDSAVAAMKYDIRRSTPPGLPCGRARAIDHERAVGTSRRQSAQRPRSAIQRLPCQ
jgi:hypothetical protein